MIIKNIYYSSHFKDEFQRLPFEIQKRADQKVELFRQNPLYPSLRLHILKGKLRGFYSISITDKYRIVFARIGNGDIIFISIGKHDIYKFL